ncbi:Hint domain-containing protein [Yoonia maritima]|uniref:Hint domain-containing protein n=1 Tax=Yoonia maritima TaxID=1435347 RepID=UPI001FAF3C18|nr:Hint domain-containing protein [Yoonia maritima]
MLTNGDFSSGLTDWTVTGAGPTSPTADAASGGVIFGYSNDVQDGDSISQGVNLTAGEEYSFTLTLSEVGPSLGYGGGALTIDLQDNASSGFTNIGSITVGHEETNTVTFTFTSPYDSSTLIIRGQYAFGDGSNYLLLDDLVLTPTTVPCFTRGTMIHTPNGPKAIEKLKVGDLVDTLDHGPQAIRWIGTSPISFVERPLSCKLRPIIIRAGALGPGVPHVDMRVSRQHRMLISSKIAERMFNVPQVLIPAVRLLILPNVEIDEEVQEIDYLHLMFDRHQVIWADGAPAESFFFGPEAIKYLEHDAREEVEALFPELVSGEAMYEPARIIPVGKKQKKLIERHASNSQDLLSNRFLRSGLRLQVDLR